jgi:endonuclease/exonuclease/phosphatase (EEP) superfamily protein YafD
MPLRSHHVARWTLSLVLGLPLLAWIWLPYLLGNRRLEWEWAFGQQPHRLFLLLPVTLFLFGFSRHLRNIAWLLLVAVSLLLLLTEMTATIPWRPMTLQRDVPPVAPAWRILTQNIDEAGPADCLPVFCRLHPDAIVLQELASGNLSAWRAAVAKRGWNIHVTPLLSGSGWINTVIISPHPMKPQPALAVVNHLTGRTRYFSVVVLAKPHVPPIMLVGVQLESVPRWAGFEAFKNSWRPRYLQAACLAAYVRQSPLPVIIAGDCNATPTDRALEPLTQVMRDTWPQVGLGLGATFPAVTPSLRIDYLWHDPRLQSHQAARLIYEGNTSDHLALWGDFFAL